MKQMIMLSIKSKLRLPACVTLKLSMQILTVLFCALMLKLYYSTASPNQLRWILAPTTALVEIITGRQFEFESHAGYLSSDRTYLIAASCAGVNFLITAFLMLALRKLWKDCRGTHGETLQTKWTFIPAVALFAYLATILTNTVRISIALWLQRNPLEISWMTPNQLHRFEGIIIYFGFLLLLFIISEKVNSEKPANLLRMSFFPLMIYYATMLGIPLANGVYRGGITSTEFWEHLLFVLVIPLPLILLAAGLGYLNQRTALEIKGPARLLK
jgi:exosortase K